MPRLSVRFYATNYKFCLLWVFLVSAICVAFVLLGSIRTFYNAVMDLWFVGICKNLRIS